MMVIFTSRSEKKALLATRKILDNYADRIGNDTWRTVITEAGLMTVKSILRRNATKSMAVACHWLRSRNRSELLWIVGNRDKFDETGRVPVNTTSKNLAHAEWENTWQYMPLLKALTATAALLHDWGKASDAFQAKLDPNKKRRQTDALRHEWISCRLISAFVRYSQDSENDSAWMKKLLEQNTITDGLLQIIKEEGTGQSLKLSEFPPVARILAWLILSHHRLPCPNKDTIYKYENDELPDLTDSLTKIASDWGYKNNSPETNKKCFSFSHGLLLDDTAWKASLQEWLPRLLAEVPKLTAMLREPAEATALRPLLLYAREALMLGDHYISSLEATDEVEDEEAVLWANTGFKNGQRIRRQTLSRHLLGVARQSVKIVRNLSRLSEEMPSAQDVRFPPAKDARYAWQDKAVAAIRAERKTSQAPLAWFVVNMASTGTGKTIANAKIMQAVSPDGKSLRYALALGLRTLTLQTGTEYAERLHLQANELAVLIGSQAIQQLYEQSCANASANDEKTLAVNRWELYAEQGAGSEALLPKELRLYQEDEADFDDLNKEQLQFLALFFDGRKARAAKKNRLFLSKPVLVATIDHLMGAVETCKGGRHLLPILRMLASDVTIDEIDDFGIRDLTAIARLAHLVGLLGRNLLISSATIPPDLAKGMYAAWKDGLRCHNRFFSSAKQMRSVWVDEFRTQIKEISPPTEESYLEQHSKFIGKRILKLKEQPPKRKASLISCKHLLDMNGAELEQGYFQAIKNAAEKMHTLHHIIDAATGKNVSFGLIRLANVDPCARLSRFLMHCEWPEGISPYIMCYHSRQVLLLRHTQEQHLDKVLKRKEETTQTVKINDPILRQHIEQSPGNHVLFIVVATPVEELGRDHDFDWGIAEPSSYRSLIQLAGRILRHRSGEPSAPNLGILQYNLRAMEGKHRQAFQHPGFEEGRYVMASHDLESIVDVRALAKCLDASPRIQKEPELQPTLNLADLEHQVLQDWCELKQKFPQTIGGWQKSFWWLTALPQALNGFRKDKDLRENIQLCYRYENGESHFHEKIDGQIGGKCSETYRIHPLGELDGLTASRCWLERDYLTTLQEIRPEQDELDEEEHLTKLSEKYGDILLSKYEGDNRQLYYSDQLGLFRERND